MKRATVRDLRYAFPSIESALADGETIEIVKRNKVLGHLTPVSSGQPPMPDFKARMKEIWGERILTPSNAEIIAIDREEGV